MSAVFIISSMLLEVLASDGKYLSSIMPIIAENTGDKNCKLFLTGSAILEDKESAEVNL